jgi:hypothetical protein
MIKKLLERRSIEKQKKHREVIPEARGNLRFPLDFYLSWMYRKRKMDGKEATKTA